MKKIKTGCQDKLDWFDGKHINEILFCQEFLKTRYPFHRFVSHVQQDRPEYALFSFLRVTTE